MFCILVWTSDDRRSCDCACVWVHKSTKLITNNLVNWPHLCDVELDNVDCGEVLLLIGCDVSEEHWVWGDQMCVRRIAYAVRTLLWWSVFGTASNTEDSKWVVHHSRGVHTLDDQVRELADVQFADVYSSDKSVSVEDNHAQRFNSQQLKWWAECRESLRISLITKQWSVCSRTIPVRLRSRNAEIVCYALSHISFHVTLMKSDCVEVGRVEGNLSVGGNAHCVW